MDPSRCCHFPASVLLSFLSFCTSSVVQGVPTEIETVAQKWGDKTACEHLSSLKYGTEFYFGNYKTWRPKTFRSSALEVYFLSADDIIMYFCTFKRSHLMLNAQHLHIEFRSTQLFPPKMFLLKISTTLFQFQVFKFAIRKSDNFRTWNWNLNLGATIQGQKNPGCILYFFFCLTFSHKMRLIYMKHPRKSKRNQSIRTNVNEEHHSTGYTALSLGGLYSNSCLPYHNNQRYLIISFILL